MTPGYHARTISLSGADRRTKIDQLEQAMHRVAGLGRLQAVRARHRPALLTQARDPLGVVAIGTALEERERRVRQPTDPVQRRRRQRRQLRQPVPARGGRSRQFGEQRELALALHGGCFRLDDRLRRPPVDGQHEPCFTPLQLTALELAVEPEPREHPADGRVAVLLAVGIDRAGDDQPVDRTRHRDVVEAQPFGRVLPFLRLAHLLVAEDAALLARLRIDHTEPERPVRTHEDLVGGLDSAGVAAGVGDDHDLELEPFRRVDRQQTHRVCPFFLGDGLEL